MLPDDVWLKHAQSLGVGQTARIRHGNESRVNMTIGNSAGHWWAYCQRCKEGAKRVKEHVLLTEHKLEAPPVELHVPSDMVPVVGSEYAHPVGVFLASRGMMFPYLPPLWYSEKARRVLLQDRSGGWHGRDLTGRSSVKWLHYMKPHIVGDIQSCTVITEDILSMYKVRFALRSSPNIGVASTLGAGCSVQAALALRNCERIVWAYDGDSAGDHGYASAEKRMRLLVPKNVRARPPDGLDPKDLSCAQIRALILEKSNDC